MYLCAAEYAETCRGRVYGPRSALLLLHHCVAHALLLLYYAGAMALDLLYYCCTIALPMLYYCFTTQMLFPELNKPKLQEAKSMALDLTDDLSEEERLRVEVCVCVCVCVCVVWRSTSQRT